MKNEFDLFCRGEGFFRMFYDKNNSLKSDVKNLADKELKIRYNNDKNINSGIYTGSIDVYGNRQKRGEMIYDNGNEYNGEWKDDKINGIGKMKYKNGDVYEGFWMNGKEHGTGMTTSTDGVRYSVLYDDGVLKKKEKQTDTKNYTYGKAIDSCYYIGELNEKGEPHGRGTMFFSADDGRKKYIGDFKNNKIEGQGIMIDVNDNVYGGQFTDGKLNGRGTLSFSNGKIYSGNFENGLPEKEGMYFTTDGSSYEGNFVKGKEQGNGGKMYFGKNFQKYVGDFKDCLFNGPGVLFYPDGSFVKGYWEDSRLKEGIYKYANGTTIEIKDFKLKDFKHGNAVRHKNAYMIYANATGEQKFYKIGTYGFCKEIFYSDNDFVNSAIPNVEEDGCLTDLEEKIQQNQVKQITLCLDVHGTEQNELCINEKELKLLLSKLKVILTKYPDVKLYIQNLSCFASTILEYNFGNIMEYLKTHVRISNLDDVIKYYFRDIGEKRVFYTKSIKENNKTMIDKIFEHHVASNKLTNEDIKFEYWVLDKGELKRYDLGSHEKNKMQKNIDLFGLAETRQIVDDKKRALNSLICNLKEKQEKKETDYSYREQDLQLQLEDKLKELLEAEKEILIPAEQEKYQGLNNINIDVKINKDIIDNKKSECKNI